MRIRSSIYAVAMAAVLALVAVSCRTQRQAASTATSEVPSDQVSQPRTPRTPATDFAAMTGAYTPWTTLSVPVKVSVTKPAKASVSGTLKMVYGKSMSLSLKMLFIEVLSVYADTDSVLIISKPMDVYYAESLSAFTARTGFTLADLQSLFLGQLFVPGKGTATAAAASTYSLGAFETLKDAGLLKWTITPRRISDGVEWAFTALSPLAETSPAYPQIFALDVQAPSATVSCTFADSDLSPAGVIASQMQVEGSVSRHDVNAVISMSADHAQWNTGITISRPNIPKGARRLTTAQLLSSLKNL